MSELRIQLLGRNEARIARDGDRLTVEIIDTGEDGCGVACQALLHLEGADFRMVREMMMDQPKCKCCRS